MNTGYIIKQYIDINPLSPTYNQTWTERVLDTDHCPQSADDWVEIANYCEIVASGYTGNRQIMYYSDSLNAYSSVTRPDTSCTPSSSEEQWVNDGEPYCEQVDGKNTGYMIQKQIQKNINLVNYGETREMKYQSDECGEPTPTGDTCPHWQEIMRYCNIINDSGTTLMDGTSNVAQIDNNPNSSRYNETRTINVYDSGCSNMVGATFEWVEIGDYCGDSDILCDEGTPMVKTTLYTVYRRRKTINGTTTNMDELSAVTKEIGSQTCGADVRRQWVRTDDTECVGDPVKAILTLNDGSKVEIPGSGELVSAEISAYQATCVSAEITTACTSIGVRAFYYCTGLTSVTISNSVTRISNFAFESCTGLTSATIGSGITSIGSGVFSGCKSLTSVNIPSGVTSIGNQAFMNCSSLTSITIPSGVTSIESGLFEGCSGLTSITIPSGVTSIESSAFLNCSSLTSITIPSGVTSIEYRVFQGCSSLANITIPSGVTSIGQSAFRDCSGLTSVTIPNKVTSVGYAAFSGCTSLTSITCNPTTPPFLGGNVFDNTNDCPIYVPCESVNAYKAGYGWSSYADRITCVPPYKAKLTLNNGSIATISGSGELTSAETSAYSTNTIMVEIGSACTGLGNYVFYPFMDTPFSAMTAITISDSVTSFGWGSFFHCSSLTSVTIPNSVSDMGTNTFGGCSGLRSVTIGTAATSIPDACFRDCVSLTSVTINVPNSISSIGAGAFLGCSGLTSFAIPDRVTSISAEAFSGCTGLESINIPNSVTSIGYSAFENCSDLASITCDATTPPTLGIRVFDNTNNCPIYVPAASVSAYKSATNWSTYASRITAIP